MDLDGFRGFHTVFRIVYTKLKLRATPQIRTNTLMDTEVYRIPYTKTTSGSPVDLRWICPHGLLGDGVLHLDSRVHLTSKSQQDLLQRSKFLCKLLC